MPDIGLIIVDPGHFHVALAQQEMYPNVSARAHVYAPLGPDLLDYLTRIARFNSRAERPTSWEIEIHASPDFFERMSRERPGNVAIFSGRNGGKIERVAGSIAAGINVLADKPLIIRREDFPMLEAVLKAADERQLILCDMMGGRHEITANLTRLLREDPEVFGDAVKGTTAEPGAAMTSVHHIFKEVAGVPNPRPAWYFDIEEQGEGLADAGTHMVDRVHRTLFPEQAIDHRTDIRLHSANRWPTMLSLAQFGQVTGEVQWQDYLQSRLKGGALEYFCNTRLHYQVRGVHVTLETRWDWEALAGGDTNNAAYRGGRARLEIRQGGRELASRTVRHAASRYRRGARATDRSIAGCLSRGRPGATQREMADSHSRRVAAWARCSFHTIDPPVSGLCRASALAPVMGARQHARKVLRLYRGRGDVARRELVGRLLSIGDICEENRCVW